MQRILQNDKCSSSRRYIQRFWKYSLYECTERTQSDIGQVQIIFFNKIKISYKCNIKQYNWEISVHTVFLITYIEYIYISLQIKSLI